MLEFEKYPCQRHEGIWGSRGIARTFLTSALDGGDKSASRPGRCTPRGKLPVRDLETSTMMQSRPELRLLRQGKEKSINHEAPHDVIFSNLLSLFFQRRLSSSALSDTLLQFL